MLHDKCAALGSSHLCFTPLGDTDNTGYLQVAQERITLVGIMR